MATKPEKVLRRNFWHSSMPAASSRDGAHAADPHGGDGARDASRKREQQDERDEAEEERPYSV